MSDILKHTPKEYAQQLGLKIPHEITDISRQFAWLELQALTTELDIPPLLQVQAFHHHEVTNKPGKPDTALTALGGLFQDYKDKTDLGLQGKKR